MNKNYMMKLKREGLLTALILAALVVVTGACNKKNEIERNEVEQIEAYLKYNDLNIEPTESGLYYIELIMGNGERPVDGDTVFVTYTGRFLSGQVFDSNVGGIPFGFTVGEGQVIAGWDEGLKLMRLNETALFIVPSWLGYGKTGSYPIPGYTPLLFQVKLNTLIPGPNH